MTGSTETVVKKVVGSAVCYSRGAALRVAEHVLAGYGDLSHLNVSQHHLAFVSLFDETEDVWREKDFSLVEQQSIVALWPRPDEFERILLAA